MKFQMIRNATIRLEYAGTNILFDPMLGPKHSFGAFAGIEKNPTVELPMPASKILEHLDLLLLSHLHEDHFDALAQEIIQKSIPILCQPGDQQKIESYAFENVVELKKESMWGALHITRTGGQHGTGQWAKRLNPVSGFVLKSQDEPTVYWIGDSVWCDEVKVALETHKPDVIITHSGGAELEDSGPILMDASQTIDLCKLYPSSLVIATHMDALDHCKTSRKDLRRIADRANIDPLQLLIPENGDQIEKNISANGP